MRRAEGQACVNLADPALGAAVIRVSDDFFAAAKRMLAASEPVFVPGRYDEHGKWMDGWESRRRRDEGHDSCLLRICPGMIHEVDIDTTHFTGNFPPAASIEACRAEGDPGATAGWREILPRTPLQGDSHHRLCVAERGPWTHLRLHIYPDGGVARLRVYGIPENAGAARADPGWADLACADNGGEALDCNDMHFGHMSNLLKPGAAADMGDGWETRRRRKPGNDWVLLRLGEAGRIRRVEVDTDFFKGNHPAACSLRGCLAEGGPERAGDPSDWPLILPRVALGPDQLQVFQREVRDVGTVSHVRFDIFPDGGVARLRLLGEPRGTG